MTLLMNHLLYGVQNAERITLMNVTKLTSTPWNAPELRGNLAGMRYPAFAEIKLDGEFNFIEFNGKDIRTINKYGTQKTEFHDLQKMFYMLEGSGVKQAVLLCELYWDKGKSGDLYKFLCHKTDNNVHIHVFDVLMRDDVDLRSEPLVSRKEHLWEMVGQWQIGDVIVNNPLEAEGIFVNTTSNGYEGIVLKSLDSPLILGPCSWVKMKYKDRNDYRVVTLDLHKERIEVEVPQPPIRKPSVIVGVKAPNRYKKHIKIGDMVTIEHQGVLESGSLRHPVLIPKKEWL